MTIEEKREALEAYCEGREICNGCVFHTVGGCMYDDNRVDESYNLVFGGEQNVQREKFTSCCDCQFEECDEENFPCTDCIHHDGTNECFEPINSGTTPEEINHPDRYKSGKFECIDVMIDVFGTDAVKHFCILNAFKYL